MSDLSVKYLGLEMKNPILVASCSLTGSVSGIQELADAGAGGVVLKSLFEEQIDAETKDIEQYIGPSWHTEAYDYVRNMGMELGPNAYLKLVEAAKKAVSIPVIASLNCVSERWWADYARKLELAGADALELNVAYLPSDLDRNAQDIETLYFRIIEDVRKKVQIPIAVKIGPFFTSLAKFSQELVKRGAGGLVFFNRFYQVDIDLEKIILKPGYKFSAPEEMSLPLRWIALLSDRIECDFAATTGVHDGLSVAKMILAGAGVVQVCSALYNDGKERVGKMVKELQGWMDKKGYDSVAEFKGKLSREQSDQPELWDRLQYIKALVGIE